MSESAPALSLSDLEEWALQTSVMRPHSPAAIERGKRLSAFLLATKNKVWVGELLVDRSGVEPNPHGHSDGAGAHREWRLRKTARRYMTKAERPEHRG